MVDKHGSKIINSTNSKRPNGDDTYSRVIKQISNEGLCPFCEEHGIKYHSNPFIIKGRSWLVSKSAFPYEGSEHHLIFIHRKHIEHISEVSAEEWVELKNLSEQMVIDFNIEGATFLMRFGATERTGATVNHLHAQLISGSGAADAKPVMTRVG